jgi:hypothetical protein
VPKPPVLAPLPPLAPQITPEEEIRVAVLLLAIQVSPPAGPFVLLVSAGTPPAPI